MGYCTAVLVTGATGLIGSDVVVRLVIRGRRPVLAVTHRNHTSRSATAAT
ncbi:NAD-dependent epimerase/dehydratase family protein [Nocardia mexicana]|uniref:NAD-dependent epimerase/dehydratase family protein n=1 Tax=Nocardia mexicana TaxID=279262 RepID=A0A370GNP3_9NOCA|nr:NAD-dependent epimerase/dehydratase family protein [Nocardia mexicana]